MSMIIRTLGRYNCSLAKAVNYVIIFATFYHRVKGCMADITTGKKRKRKRKKKRTTGSEKILLNSLMEILAPHSEPERLAREYKPGLLESTQNSTVQIRHCPVKALCHLLFFK